ncbi:nuclear transport factor 2 family protein [Aestuariivirga sp.]|uniref:nuclear transport factor 2 family protein n=1 Tax=Aestuariivirga sp. TaxID=2650926 RepID=UPI00391BE13D
MTRSIPTIDGLRRAIETRDARSLTSFYADDAVLTIIDSDNPPSKPRTITGAKNIGAFLDDVYGRDMTHNLEMGLIEGGRLAFVQGCQYGDGTRVIASSTAELGPHGIVRQTTVQAWDS